MNFFVQYLKQRRRGIGVFFLFSFIFLAVFLLYHLPLGAVAYPVAVSYTHLDVYKRQNLRCEYAEQQSLPCVFQPL